MNRSLPKFYSEHQMVALAKAPNPTTRKGARDRAIISVLCATGLRATELCSLTPRDVTDSLVFVRHGKGGVQRYVPISSPAHRAVSNYLANHPANPNQPIFRTGDGHPLSRRLLHKIVTGYSRRLGLTGGVHTIRHSAATRWLNHGISLQSVRAMLGHVTIVTTSIYLGVSTIALIAEYRRCLEGGVAR